MGVTNGCSPFAALYLAIAVARLYHASQASGGREVVNLKLFKAITKADALASLRSMLAAIGVEKAECYRSHDMRRGHTLDLQCAKAPLWQILEAGEWSLSAFLKYLDLHKLDQELVVQAHCLESDSDSG